MTRSFLTRPVFAPFLLLLVLLAGCGTGDIDDAPAEEGLDCERLAYPCDAADVPVEVAREGMRLAEAVLERFHSVTGAEVLEWLRRQPDVVDALGDASSWRFRLNGGRPVAVLSAEALGYAPRRDVAATAARAPAIAVNRPGDPAHASTILQVVGPTSEPRRRPGETPASGYLNWLLPPVTLFAEVAGRDRDGDAVVTDRDFRRALVLDPFHWEWSRLTSYAYREGIEVTRILEDTRGFDNGVVRYLRDREAGESAFTDWADYDVVHFSGHGKAWCEYDDSCFSMLFTGDTVTADGVFDDSTLGLGRETAVMQVPDPGTGSLVVQRHVGIGADWFRDRYRGVRLDGTLVFLSGCATMTPGAGRTVPDFMAPLLGAGATVVLGWTEVVPGAPAQDAAIAFYAQMSKEGLRAGDVLRRLEARGLTSAVNGGGQTAQLQSGSRDGASLDAAKLRVREVVALHTPGGGRMVDGLQPPDVFTGAAGDGKDDTLNVDLVVDGVEPQQIDSWSVDVELNGQPIRRGVRLSTAHKTGDFAYRVPLRDVPLGKDLEPGQRDTLEAVADLPEGGESRAKIEIEPGTCYWRADMTGTVARPIGGYAVSVGRMTLPGPSVGDDARVLSTIGLGQAPGEDEVSDGLTFFIQDEIDERSFPISFGIRAQNGAWLGTREVPVGTRTQGQVRVTLYEPGRMVVGGFALAYSGLALPDFDDADIEIRGEFVWTPACPTVWEQLEGLGLRTADFLQQRGVQ